MADGAGEKTEKATSRKRQEERKQGNVFQSKEIVIAATLVATFVAFKFLYPLTRSAVFGAFRETFHNVESMDTLSLRNLQTILISGIKAIAIGALPLLLITGLIAIVATIAQTRGLMNFTSLKPKFSRMNPISGMKRLFSLKAMVELVKALIKIAILFAVIYQTIQSSMYLFPKMINMTFTKAASEVGSLCFGLVIRLSIVFAFIAFLDLLYQKWEYEKNIRMTKEEVKQEYKNIEGDPKIKGKIKQRQQAMSRRRMMQAVPAADVVIRNPTHFAVALKYDAEKNHAPVVVAKGQDELAFRIIEKAQEHNVFITENPPLARALYAQVDLDREIPFEFYKAVSEVLALVYRIRKYQGKTVLQKQHRTKS